MIGIPPHSDGRYDFRKLRFGYAEAEVEGARDPQLLIDGYLDPGGYIEEARNGYKFLFLGYKGSGKSAIAEHLRLLAEADPGLFVTVTTVSDFPFTDFARIVGGDAETEARLPTAWAWLLLVQLFGSLVQDEGAPSAHSGEFPAAKEVLRKLGLFPAPELKKVARISSKANFKLQIPMVFEGVIERDMTDEDARIPLFAERLGQIASAFKTSSKHLLVVDGLDVILTQREIQYDALAALILEASRLNLQFERARAPLKIILLCRTDLFERLPGANKNKVRQDSAVMLDWYHNPRDASQSNLTSLANLRAGLTYPQMPDVVDLFIPRSVNKRVPPKQFLFELTRHTPRDFLQLLSKIQMYAGPGKLTVSQVLAGVREYSMKYFVPELKDELVGYVPEDHVQLIFDLMGSLRSREFSFAALAERASERRSFQTLDLEGALRALFECSAIGNVQNKPTGTTYYTFKYRNPFSTLSLNDRILLHKGMWKAMNLI